LEKNIKKRLALGKLGIGRDSDGERMRINFLGVVVFIQKSSTKKKT